MVTPAPRFGAHDEDPPPAARASGLGATIFPLRASAADGSKKKCGYQRIETPA